MDRWKRSMDRGRCEHDTFPVEVMPVGVGKKIAYCLGCERSGPVRPSSAEALTALRETPWPAFLSASAPDEMGFSEEERAKFTRMHSEMAKSLSAHGEHLIVKGADHFSIVADRWHARAVATAIEQVIQGARIE